VPNLTFFLSTKINSAKYFKFSGFGQQENSSIRRLDDYYVLPAESSLGYKHNINFNYTIKIFVIN